MHNFLRSAWAAYLVLVISLLATGIAWHSAWRAAEERDRSRFEQTVRRIPDAVDERIRDYIRVIRDGRRVVETGQPEEHKNWHDYFAGLSRRTRYPALQGLGYARRAIAKETTTRQEDGKGPPEYLPVVYFEPFDQSPLGYDLSSEPSHRALLEKARDDGDPMATRKLSPAEKSAVKSQILIFIPVYGSGKPRRTVEERRAALSGFVYGVLGVDGILREVLDKQGSPGIDLHLFDGKETTSENLLYGAASSGTKGTTYDPRFSKSATLEVAGQTWTFRFFTLPSFDLESPSKDLSFLMLGGGLLVSFLLFGITWAQAKTRVRAERMGAELRKSEEEMRSRYREQAALNSISAVVTQSIHVEEMLEAVLQKTLQVTGTERGYIRLKDHDTGQLVLAAHRGISQKYVETLLYHRTAGGKSDQVFQSGEPLVINDLQGAVLKDETRREGKFSVVWIPLKSRGNVVGILNLGKAPPKVFTPGEVELLEVIGNVIGVALENARLFGETRDNLKRIRALHEIDLAITSTLDLNVVLNVLLDKVVLFFSQDVAATIRLVDKQSGQMPRVTCRNLDENDWKSSNLPGNISAEIVQGRAPAMVRNILTDSRVGDPEFFRRHGLVSYLGVAMVGHEEILGVLGLYTKREHEFTAQEVEFLNTLAGQAAIAIHNAQLYEGIANSKNELESTNKRLEKTLKELSGFYTALAPLAPAESTSQLMEAIIERLIEATGADAALIRLQDGDGGFHWAAQRGFPDYYLKAAGTPPPGSALEWVFKTGEPILAPDISADSRLKGKVQLEAGFHSCAMLPLKIRNEPRGILHLASRQPGYFDDPRREQLMVIARQMGIALENKEHYDNLVASKDELAKALKVKDEFLSTMSHELRTPLNVVIGYAAMLKDRMLGAINAEQEDAVEKILARAGDQLEMINAILRATQIEAGAVSVSKQVVDLNELFQEIRSNYGCATGKELEFHWKGPAEPLLVSTDRDKVKHIIQNIVSNAVKFTEKGSITVSVLRRSWPDAIQFNVTDTGIGIPKAMLPVIFEKFRQIDSSDRREFEGVGLGLYIVKQLAELLGGTVEVESEEGKGSTFTVTLPVETHNNGDAVGGSGAAAYLN